MCTINNDLEEQMYCSAAFVDPSNVGCGHGAYKQMKSSQPMSLWNHLPKIDWMSSFDGL